MPGYLVIYNVGGKRKSVSGELTGSGSEDGFAGCDGVSQAGEDFGPVGRTGHGS